MDSFYNADAARWARETVMKMDDDAAAVFVQAATHSILMDDIRANRRTLDGKVREIQKSLYEDAQRVVSKGVLSPVRVIEDISKSWDEDKVKRDRGGRFSTTESRVRVDRTKRPMPKSRERAYGIPSARAVAQQSGIPGGKRLSPAERAAYQQQYLQLVDTMDRYSQLNAKNIQMVVEDKATGARRTLEVDTRSPAKGWNPSLQNIVALRASSEGAGSAAFDLVSALGTQRAGGIAMDATQGIERGGSAFAERWTNASQDTAGTNARTYRRIEAGSKLLGEVSGSPKAQVASKFGEFVGHYGPEAEKVVGPHLRRTAYRYRGTERKPDAKLIQERNVRVQRMEIPESDQSVAQIAARRAGVGSTVSAEQKSMASVQTSTGYLLNRLPSLKLAEIQRKSGRIPPSEGVIIDREGKIVTQAVGHADDHYLPFNLKNLKGLQGGEYVRTRTKGGLTTEDIYTGLVSGARQVTVVSNSGVFTIDFEDDFRGVRRYNDKAASMVDRYAKTLDAIQGGQIERESLDPGIKAEIRDEVERDLDGYSRQEIENEIKSRVKEYRETPTLTKGELEDINREALRLGKNEGEARAIRSELMDAAMEKKADRMYQLDGQGYAAALESLKEQYPYYIKSVSFMHKREALDADGNRTDPGSQPNNRFTASSDDGYVKPRHNRPDRAEDGYYDASINGRGKLPASQANYQNWEHNPQNRGRAGKTATAEAPAEEKAGAKPAGSAQSQYKQAQAQYQFERNHKAALKSVVDQFEGLDHEGQYKVLDAAHRDFETVYSNPAQRTQLEQEVNRAYDALVAKAPDHSMTKGAAAKMAVLRDEAGRTGGTPWTEEHLGTSGAKPYKFSGDAYEAGASSGAVEEEVGRIHNAVRTLQLSDDLLNLDDDQLRSAAAQAGVLSKVIREGGGQAGKEQLASLGLALGQDENWYQKKSEILSHVQNPEVEAKRWAKIAEAMERARRIKANGYKPQAEAAPADAPALPTKDKTPAISASEGVRYLRNIANQLGSTPEADDYNRMSFLLKEGNYNRARDLAAAMNEQSPSRVALLKQIFPDMEP